MSGNAKDELIYTALGGAGEIGMNCYLYGLGRSDNAEWIMVDLGMGFGDMDTSPGIELILPDISFIKAQASRLQALFVTHGHEDHIGAIPHLWGELKLPIYARPFTAELVRRKMAEAGLDTRLVREVRAGERITAGQFEVEFLPITHSVPEASMLSIRTPMGVVVHSGDFKLDPDPTLGDPADLGRLETLGREGVLALACDSTNVFQAGAAGSESEIAANLRRIVKASEGAVAATSFASNVARLRTLAMAATDVGRSVVVVGRAMRRMIEVAQQTGQLRDFPAMLSEDKMRDVPADHLFYLVTGSQGETRAALARIAAGSHPTVSLTKGDTVLFSSKTIPGNEAGIHRLYNKLSEQGIRVIDGDMERIHVSGHARRDDLMRVYKALRPQVSVAIHGEHRHLVEHTRWAREWGASHAPVAPNGTVVRLDGNSPGNVASVPTGRIYLDGTTQIGSQDGVIRDRLKLARQGHVIVVAVVDEEGMLIADPDVRCVGAPKRAADWPATLEQMTLKAVDEAMEGMPRKSRRTDAGIEDGITRAVRRIAMKYWGKKPMVTVIVTRLEDEE